MTLFITPTFLYHTTTRHTEQSRLYWEEQVKWGIPAPPLGQYHTDLAVPKYFTGHREADYWSFWMPEGPDQVFLEYKVKSGSVIKLVDWRSSDIRAAEIQLAKAGGGLDESLKSRGFDGYLGKEDYYEVYLLEPSKFMESFREVPFDSFFRKQLDEGWDHEARGYGDIDDETMVLLNVAAN